MQILECGPTPPSCHGHECGVDPPIPVRIGVIAPCKKVLLQKFDSPCWLSPHLFGGRREVTGLWFIVSSTRLSRVIVRPTPHGFAYEPGEGTDVHDVNEAKLLLLECTCPVAKMSLCLQVLEGVYTLCPFLRLWWWWGLCSFLLFICSRHL